MILLVSTNRKPRRFIDCAGCRERKPWFEEGGETGRTSCRADYRAALPRLASRAGSGGLIAGGGGFRRFEEFGLFDQAAEFFFADLVVRSLLGGQGGGSFIFNCQPLQLHDANVFLPLFPNLGLSQLDGFLHAG